jgi:N-acetylglucosaminyl-diphospho-decaprenol L-rhamnosyltransferase
MPEAMPATHSFSNWDVVVVSYNSARDLERWSTVPAAIRSRVILVDNGSSDDSVAVGSRLFGRVIRWKNMGLSVANNVGAAFGSAEFLLFCNPDVAPVDGLDVFEEHLRHSPGIVTPRLQHLDGEPQDNVRGWPTLLRQVANRLRHEGRSAYRWPVDPAANAAVPWVLGAAVATTREAFETVGGWPVEYFLYYEDTELCLRFWEAGYSVWVLGDVTWTHAWARSSRKLLSKTARLHMRSALRFYLHRFDYLLAVPAALERRLAASTAAVGTPQPALQPAPALLQELVPVDAAPRSSIAV